MWNSFDFSSTCGLCRRKCTDTILSQHNASYPLARLAEALHQGLLDSLGKGSLRPNKNQPASLQEGCPAAFAKGSNWVVKWSGPKPVRKPLNRLTNCTWNETETDFGSPDATSLAKYVLNVSFISCHNAFFSRLGMITNAFGKGSLPRLWNYLAGSDM